MKKNKLILIIMVVLIAVAAAFVLTDRNTTIWQNEAQFAVKDTATIVKLYMVDKNNQSVLFEKTEDGWILNGDKKAHKENVEMLLKTIKSLSVKYPVPEKAYDNTVKILSGNSIKVEIYQNDYHINIGSLHLFPYVNMSRVFYVGGATQDNQGTYMMMEGGSRPYVVTMPGFRGFVAARFTTNPKDWLSHEIFKIPYKNIAEITIETPEKPDKSVQIRKLDSGYEIMALQSRQILAAYDTVALFTFLDSFKNVNYEALLDDLTETKIDSLINSTPVHIITLKETNGKTHELKTFKMRSRYDQEEIYGVDTEYDLDRMYAWFEGQMLMVQFYTFDKITRPVDYFYPPQQKNE